MGADIAGLLAGLGGGGGGPGGPAGPGGPPPGPPGGGLDLGALLGGAGAGGGPPPGPEQGPNDDAIAVLGQILDLANKYLQVEPDEEDKLTMQKITTLIQQLKAKDQADQEQALGGGNMRLMRKAGAA